MWVNKQCTLLINILILNLCILIESYNYKKGYLVVNENGLTAGWNITNPANESLYIVLIFNVIHRPLLVILNM